MVQEPGKIQPEEISTGKEKETEDYRTEKKEMNSKGPEKSQEDTALCNCKGQTGIFTSLLISATSCLYTNFIKSKSDVLEIYTWQLKVNLYQLWRVSDSKGK